MFQNYHPVNVSAISLKGIPLLETHLTVNTTQPKKRHKLNNHNSEGGYIPKKLWCCNGGRV